jgi:hypothetical protein
LDNVNDVYFYSLCLNQSNIVENFWTWVKFKRRFRHEYHSFLCMTYNIFSWSAVC